jgi:hypothetical protein
MRGVLGVHFNIKNPSNVNLAIVLKVFTSTSKVPFIIGRLQFNTSSLEAINVECFVWRFRKLSRNEAEILLENNVFFINP